ncbi:MAG TPA: ABC transporter ATP-binding protein [Syntrophales bacterium]|nr:ABC transporter ATP-binding protein [Syntrophales bacterium]HOL59302.1 ABC transporter ATP-binding protein [Syntrophales bacterium]HPO35505.1 ABC transporter ATP-binding protein [Syntrophales bacterium]
MTEETAVSFHRVNFTYTGAPVIVNASFSIPAHTFTMIVGPNGGGKTTILKLILGLLTPTRGSIEVLGTTPENARPLVGYMPQYLHFDPHFPATVMDIVLMGLMKQNHPIGPFGKKSRVKALEALSRLGMEKFAHRPFASLSGGQRQRVLIARALACEPELLLLDEPTTNVDAATEIDLFELLREMSERMTCVVVTHDLGFVSQYVKEVVCVNREVMVHDTAQLTGEVVTKLYGCGVRMVKHQHGG